MTAGENKPSNRYLTSPIYEEWGITPERAEKSRMVSVINLIQMICSYLSKTFRGLFIFTKTLIQHGRQEILEDDTRPVVKALKSELITKGSLEDNFDLQPTNYVKCPLL